jgi:hypothetical protein
MRYSEYFEQAMSVSRQSPEESERLLRESEAHAGKSFADDLCLCGEGWWRILGNRDQAMRCLLLAESRHWDDCREQLVVAEAYWQLFQDTQSVKRCLQKAIAAAKTDDHKERIAEFLKKLGLKQGIVENGTKLA